MAGSWLLLVGVFGGGLSVEPVANNAPSSPTTPTKLRVRDATSQPGSVIDRLQNAGNLQGQTGAGLQRPSSDEQLQPNAKTDSLGAPTN